MEFRIGQRIGGRYEVHRIYGGAGKSGMGIVYVCYDHKQGGVLALKTYQEGFFHDKALFNHFKRGALAWIHLDRHPNIVQAFGIFKLGQRLYLGLEYIAPDNQGRNNLSHHLKTSIPVFKAVKWAVQFCDAMEHARIKGISPHRDIKPDNLMVTRQGQLKVSDFDLAGLGRLKKVALLDQAKEPDSSNSAPGLTFIQKGNQNAIAGTLPWMAPEQFEGITDTRSDIYSFGLVLYQMAASGRLPIFPENGDWKTAHLKTSPPPLESPLWPIIKTCLAKQPDQRFGGGDPSRGFVLLRRDLVKLWKHLWPHEPVPEPPKGAAFKCGDHNDKGVSLAALSLYKQAIGEYKKALALKPDYAPAYLNIGASLAAMGRKKTGGQGIC